MCRLSREEVGSPLLEMFKAWLGRALDNPIQALLLAEGCASWTPEVLSNQDALVILWKCDHGAGWGAFANIPGDARVPLHGQQNCLYTISTLTALPDKSQMDKCYKL